MNAAIHSLDAISNLVLELRLKRLGLHLESRDSSVCVIWFDPGDGVTHKEHAKIGCVIDWHAIQFADLKRVTTRR